MKIFQFLMRVANYIVLIGVFLITTNSALTWTELAPFAAYAFVVSWGSVLFLSSIMLDRAIIHGLGSWKMSWQLWLPFTFCLAIAVLVIVMKPELTLMGKFIGGVVPLFSFIFKFDLLERYKRGDMQ